MVNFEKQYPKENFAKQNLETVLIRLDYPVQLKIMNVEPVAYQEQIKANFPNYRKLSARDFEIKVDDLNAPELVSNPGPNIHKFLSEDQKRSVELVANYFVFSMAGDVYKGFDSTLAMFMDAFTKANEIYKIPLITRIGLRKIGRHFEIGESIAENLIEIKKLFHPSLTATITDKQIGTDIIESVHRTSFVATASKNINLQYGMQPVILENGTKSTSFFLDFDCYYQGKVELSSVNQTLKDMNELLWELYNWSITDDMRSKLRG